MPAVRLIIRSPDTHSERTYDLATTVRDLKQKFFSISGIPEDSQRLRLLHSVASDTRTIFLEHDDAMLGAYNVHDGMTIDIEDLDPAQNMSGRFVDLSQVEKFEMSQAEYETRGDTVRAYKIRHKMGRFAEQVPEGENVNSSIPSAYTVGARCQLAGIDGEHGGRGTIRFVGPTAFGKQDASFWIGIQLDEPLGKNDGSVQGQRYFSCEPNYGVFRKAESVQVGHFPPVDVADDSEEEM